MVFSSEGALGVALVNVVRGATVTLAAGFLFCSNSPANCLTLASGGSAAIIAAGGLTWVRNTFSLQLHSDPPLKMILCLVFKSALQERLLGTWK